jgi:ribonuclease P protein component
VSVRSLADPGSSRESPSEVAPPQVAFAISRAVGSAVTRNRVRRRLRAAARRLAADATLDGGALLISTRPPIVELTYDDLCHHLRRAVTAARAGRSGRSRVGA